MTAFVLDPRADYTPVLDATAAVAADGFIANLNDDTKSNGFVMNDVVFRSLYDFGMFPDDTVYGPTAPATARDDLLWYSTTDHILYYFELSSATWTPMTLAKSKEIFGFGETGIISANRNYTVPTDFATPLDAENYLRKYRIASGVIVSVNVLAGSYNHATYMQGHPNGDQIKYIGIGYTGTAPTDADFTATGYVAATIAANAAANVAMLNGKYRVKISCTGTGLNLVGANSIHMTDFLFVGPGRTVAGSIGADIDSSAYLYGCSFVAFEQGVYNKGFLSFDKHIFVCDCQNGSSAGFLSESGTAIYETNGVVGAYNCNGFGVAGARGGAVTGYNVYARGNLQVGIGSNNGGAVFAAVQMVGTFNGMSGASPATNGIVANFIGGNCQFQNNGQHGISAAIGGSTQLYTPTVSGNGNNGASANTGAKIVLLNAVNVNNNTDHGITSASGSVVTLASGATVKNNGINGLNANGGRIDAPNVATVPNTSTEIFATNGGYILCATAVGAPAFSPAVNTVGNFGSFIRN